MPKIDWLETVRCLEREYGTQKELAVDLGVRARTIRGWKEFEKYGRVQRARNLRNSPNYGKVYYRAEKYGCIVYEEAVYELLRKKLIVSLENQGIPYFDIETVRTKLEGEFGDKEDREMEIQQNYWLEIFEQITDCAGKSSDDTEETVLSKRNLNKLESERIDLENRNVDYYVTYDLNKKIVENWNIWEDDDFIKPLKEALREMGRMEVLRDFERKIG